jgi:hypothetical protein
VASHPQRMLTLAGDAGDVLGCYQAPLRPPTFSFWCVACGSCVGFGCIVESHGNPAMCTVWRRARLQRRRQLHQMAAPASSSLQGIMTRRCRYAAVLLRRASLVRGC